MPRPGRVFSSEVLELPDSLEAVEAHFRSQGWTDGLPIVPPTEARVETMLAGIDADPDHVVGKIPPLWAEATVEKVAINAVMAGCGPEAMPVLVAALEAMLDPAFNLYGVQATTHPVAPLLIVHGPAVARRACTRALGSSGPGTGLMPPWAARYAWPLVPWRRSPGPGRHGHAGEPRQVHVRDRRARRHEPVGPAAREPRARRRRVRRDGLRRRSAPQRQRPREPEGVEPAHRDRRHRRHPRVERGLVLPAEPAARRPRPGARGDDRRGRLHAPRRAALRVRARPVAAPSAEARRDVGHSRLAALDGDDGRPRAPADRARPRGRLRHGRRGSGSTRASSRTAASPAP